MNTRHFTFLSVLMCSGSRPMPEPPQSVDLTFSGANPHPIAGASPDPASSWVVGLNYRLPIGQYSNLRIELLMPDVSTHPVIQMLGQSSASGWTYILDNTNPLQQKLVWTSGTMTTADGISGTFPVTVKAQSLLSVALVNRFTRTGTHFPFTATLSGEKAGVPFSTSDSDATQYATGSPIVGWQYGLSQYRYFNGSFNGAPAIIARYNLRAVVCGNAPLEGYDAANDRYGLYFRVNLGANLHYLNAWWGDNNAVWPGSDLTGSYNVVLSTPGAAYGQPSHTPGGVITARWNAPMIPNERGCSYTNNFFVDIAYPCSEGPWDWSTPSLQMSVDDPSQAASGAPVQGWWLEADGTPAALDFADIIKSRNPDFTACSGGLPLVQKSTDGSSAPGTLVGWDERVTLAYGSLIDDHTIFVDKLPPVTNPQTELIALKSTATSTAYYFCDLSGETPAVDYFGWAQLQTYLGLGKCGPAVQHPRYPPTSSYLVPAAALIRATHYVVSLPPPSAYNNTYPASDPPGMGLGYTITTTVPADQSSDYINCSQVVGSIDGGTAIGADLTQESPTVVTGSVGDDRFEDCATRKVPTVSCSTPGIDPTWFQTRMAPGDCARWFFQPRHIAGTLVPRNPTYRVTVPVGVRLLDVASVPDSESQPDGTQVYGTCGGQNLAAISEVTPEPFPAGVTTSPTTIDISFGTSANPCVLDWREPPVNTKYFAVNFCVDDQQAWANGDVIRFSVETTGADNGGSYTNTKRVWDTGPDG